MIFVGTTGCVTTAQTHASLAACLAEMTSKGIADMGAMEKSDGQVSFDSASRSERWGILRSHLEQLEAEAGMNAERIARLIEEAEKASAANRHIAEVVQELRIAANEEVQREVSLTLNDTDYEVVVDGVCEIPDSSTFEGAVMTEEDFVNELEKLPGIAEKSALRIAAYVAGADAEAVLRFADALHAVNAGVWKQVGGRQSKLEFD